MFSPTVTFIAIGVIELSVKKDETDAEQSDQSKGTVLWNHLTYTWCCFAICITEKIMSLFLKFKLQLNWRGYSSGLRANASYKSDSRGFTDFWHHFLTSFFQPRGSPKYDPKKIFVFETVKSVAPNYAVTELIYFWTQAEQASIIQHLSGKIQSA